MWRALSSWRDESDGEFVIWHVRTASDDGRAQTVHVWVDVRSVAIEESPAGGGELFEVQQAIKTRGMSVIELNQDLEDLPASFVYRRGSGGFVEK